jgi:putative ABC transport system permease protein
VPERWHADLRRRLSDLGLDPSRECEIVEELAQHLDDRYEELRVGGASHEDAHRAPLEELLGADALARAMRPLGQAHVAPRECVAYSTRWLEAVRRDCRFAIRVLWRRPRFVAAVLATLALGIGVNVAVFSVLDAVLVRPLPFGSRSERVVTLHSVFGQQVSTLGGVSYPDLLDFNERILSFEGLAGLVGQSFTLSRETEANRLLGYYVTPDLFPSIGGRAGIGPLFLARGCRSSGI